MRGQIGERKEKEVVSDISIELAALAILIAKRKLYQTLQLNWQPLQFSAQKK
jgi:hypothetical protein